MLSLKDAVAAALLPKPPQPTVNGPLVPKPVWEVVGSDSEYTDYEHWIPDVNGYGARLCISLCHEDRTAYARVVIDDQLGDRYIDDQVPGDLPWEVAIAMTNHLNRH